ncbi:hypothetical protein [Moraxella lacunata]
MSKGRFPSWFDRLTTNGNRSTFSFCRVYYSSTMPKQNKHPLS